MPKPSLNIEQSQQTFAEAGHAVQRLRAGHDRAGILADVLRKGRIGGYGSRSGEVARRVVRFLVRVHGFTEQEVEVAGRVVLADEAAVRPKGLESNDEAEDSELEGGAAVADPAGREPARRGGVDYQADSDASSETAARQSLSIHTLMTMPLRQARCWRWCTRQAHHAAGAAAGAEGRLCRAVLRRRVAHDRRAGDRRDRCRRSPGRLLRRQGAGTSTSASRASRSPGARSLRGTAGRSGSRATAPERTSRAAASW